MTKKSKIKAIKALAERGVGGEKENAKRMYRELSKKGRKKPDTKEMKNAKMYINKKIDLMCKEGWDKNCLKTILREKFKVGINQVESIEVARNMYEYLIWLTHLVKGKKYNKKHTSLQKTMQIKNELLI